MLRKLDKNLIYKLVFTAIILIGIFFRFYNFPHNPPSLNWDEVSIGYNAHSILQTGMDEYGNKFPLYLRSLDDYKQPVYLYLVVVSEAIFGYGDFSVRFPSAFFGVLSIFSIYLLTFQITKKRENALISSFLFAILPWSVTFSRFGLEANVGLFFLISGIYLFIKSFENRKWYMPLSFLFFGLSTYTYLSLKVITPLIIIGLFILFFKKINFKEKTIYLGIFLFLLISFLIFRDTFLNSSGQVRLSGTSILNQQETLDIERQRIITEGELGINLPRKIFHETPLFTNLGLVSRGYLVHFNPDFYFFDLKQKAHFTPEVGLIYIWMLPFIFFGAYKLFAGYKGNERFIPLLVLVVSPIPAAFTFDVPHAIRAYTLIIPLLVFTSVGIFEFFNLFGNKKIKLVIFILFTFIIFMYSWQFFRQFNIHLPAARSHQWQYGREEMTNYLFENKDKYEKIVISSKLEWPYIFMLYYSKYDPKIYLEQGGTISGSWNFEGNKFDNFYFHKFSDEDMNPDVKTLLVGSPDDFNKDIGYIKVINYLNKKPAVYFVERTP